MLKPDCVYENGKCKQCGEPLGGPRVFRNCRSFYGRDERAEHPSDYSGEQAPTSGPGTELSQLLKRFGIEPTPNCACRAKAAEMDAWGPDECSKPERIDEVVAVMRAEAEARGLPFVEMAAKLLIRRAIHNARKATQQDKMN